MSRDSRGRFKKGHKAKTRRNPSRRKKARRTRSTVASNPPRRRRRRARRHAVASNPPRRRRRRARRHYASNPGPVRSNPRRRRRRSYRRNPGASVGGWLLAGGIAVVTTIGAGWLAPRVLPQAVLGSPLLYGGLMIALGVGAGIGLTKAGYPNAAVGVGIPLATLGGYMGYIGVSSAIAASSPAPKVNPSRAFRATHPQGQIPGPMMGALASYTPQGMGAVFPGMGAVFQGAYMGAVESMVGDQSMRPAVYGRMGQAVGAR